MQRKKYSLGNRSYGTSFFFSFFLPILGGLAPYFHSSSTLACRGCAPCNLCLPSLGTFLFYNNITKVLLYSNEALCKFCKQSLKIFGVFRFWGPQGAGESLYKIYIYIYVNIPPKKYILRTSMCSNTILFQILSNWRRIFGNLRFWQPPGDPRDTLCLYIFSYCKKTSTFEWKFFPKFISNW